MDGFVRWRRPKTATHMTAPVERRRAGVLALAVVVSIALALFGGPAGAQAVGLGTAESFAVLAGTTVTNTGPTQISGNVGVSPGTAVVGFPPGIVTNGTIHAANAEAAQAQADLTTAYNDAAGRTCTPVNPELGNQVLGPGVYCATTLAITGTLTLDAQGNPDAVFIFQAGSTLITASGSRVELINGANPCNVFWQVGSSATLGTNSVFVGTILALTSITANTGAVVTGRLLARNGAVTLDSNTITRPLCAPTTTTTAPTTTAPTTTAPGAGGGLAKTSEIPVGGGRIFRDEKVVVTQPQEGTFAAFSAVCTHQGCTVSEVAGGTINCKCHGSTFAVADGSVESGPATRPLDAKQVKVEGDQIIVS